MIENASNREKMLESFRGMGPVLALLLLIIVLSILLPPFRTLNNAMLVLRQASIVGFVAFGMTCVILTGGIDLSVGSTMALTAIISALLIQGGIPEALAIPAVLACGLLLGLVNGVTITLLRLQPFIATLIGMSVFRGFALILSGGRPISGLREFSIPILEYMGRGVFIGIPAPVWLFAAVFAMFFFLLNMTTLGRRIYAVGSNPTAAQLTGVSIVKTKMFVYAVSGLMASVSGMILVSRLGSAQPIMGKGLSWRPLLRLL